jgi:predicted RNase H-like HicB family nuclease
MKWGYRSYINIIQKSAMKTIRIIIEKNEDGYWGYAENESGITGGGETVQACKQDILDCIDTFKLMTAKNRPTFFTFFLSIGAQI